VSDTAVIALDLSGPTEPLGNWMDLLADELDKDGRFEIIRFRTVGGDFGPNETVIPSRIAWAPLWRRGRGRCIDALLPKVSLVHVAGQATPPTKHVPLVVSVDDLRQLRDDSRGRQRADQLRRAVSHGAQLVASSRTASLEVQSALDLLREHVVVVPPPVQWSETVDAGHDLVVNLTGRTNEFLLIADALVALARRRDAKVVVLASSEAEAKLRAKGVKVSFRPRRQAADVLRNARTVVHLSDGARFPSFAIAALAAGVPTCATMTSVNRELLDGAAWLVDESDPTELVGVIESLFEDDARRAVMAAAGRSRAADFSPAAAARSYAELYESVLRRRLWS